jgi:hypothetical protein
LHLLVVERLLLLPEVSLESLAYLCLVPRRQQDVGGGARHLPAGAGRQCEGE